MPLGCRRTVGRWTVGTSRHASNTQEEVALSVHLPGIREPVALRRPVELDHIHSVVADAGEIAAVGVQHVDAVAGPRRDVSGEGNPLAVGRPDGGQSSARKARALRQQSRIMKR
jgi:hypothetical protein